MNFCVDFGAEDAGRLTPFKDDKPKDTENSPFEASSVLVVKAKTPLCGFDSTTAFDRVFLSHTGISPSKYKAASIKDDKKPIS